MDLRRIRAHSLDTEKRKQKYSQKLLETIATKPVDHIERVIRVISSLGEAEFSADDIKDIVNMPDAKGVTPLLKVLECMFPEKKGIVKKLLSLGAEPPLVLMSLNGRLTPEIIHIFANAGTNMCATDSDGNTALSPEVFLSEWTKVTSKERVLVNKWILPAGDPFRVEGFTTQVKVAKELLMLGVPIHNKGRIPRIAGSFGNKETEQPGENLLVLIAAGGYEQLREYYRDGLLAEAFSGIDTKNKIYEDARFSMLTLLSLALIYPDTSKPLQELWHNMPQAWGLNALLDNLKDAGEGDMETFVPLFLNIMDIQGSSRQRDILRIKNENSKVLIRLLSAAAEGSPGAVAQFISRKLKGQIKTWVRQEGMEELTTKLSAFMRDKEMRGETLGGISF